MSRWQAFAIHLGISIVAFVALLAIILLIWYPGILFNIDGGWTGLRIIIGVDLVLGPLLTLIVFKAGKPGLKFDLTAIALFQAVCMAGGMWIVYNERPLALVHAYDTIYSLAEDEFVDYERDPALLQDMPGSYPKLVYTELPENYIQADIVAIRSQYIGDPLFIQTERYRAMPQNPDELAAIYRREDATRNLVTEELRQRLPQDCLFSRFVSAVTSGFVCLDPDSRELTEFYSGEYLREEAQ